MDLKLFYLLNNNINCYRILVDEFPGNENLILKVEPGMNVKEWLSNTLLILKKSLCITTWSQSNKDVKPALINEAAFYRLCKVGGHLETRNDGMPVQTSLGHFLRGRWRLAAKAVDPSASPLPSRAAGGPLVGAVHSCSWSAHARTLASPPATSLMSPYWIRTAKSTGSTRPV